MRINIPLEHENDLWMRLVSFVSKRDSFRIRHGQQKAFLQHAKSV